MREAGPLLAGIVACVSVLLGAEPAAAQVRGFADVGTMVFTASESFNATLGTRAGVVFGGGADVQLPGSWFVALRASLFRHAGRRVFVFEGEPFDLNVKTTVTVAPVAVMGGYRFSRAVRGVVPYAAGGVGWHRLKETAESFSDAENTDEVFTGFHLLGGAELPIARLLAAAAEVEWATVPDALGVDPNSVGAAFDEHDLGGFTFRVKIVIGR